MTMQEYQDAVEAMVDKGGIRGLLAALEAVCHEKAEHLASAWQDEAGQRAWRKVAKTVEKANMQATDLGL